MTVNDVDPQTQAGDAHLHAYLAGTSHPRIFGHRGFVSPDAAQRGIVENTREAFAAAIDAGASHIESDCRLTSDGRVVLFHDNDLVRVLGDSRECAAVSYDELAALLADRGGLLALDDALEAFPAVRFNIDIKTPGVAEAAGRILGQYPERVLVTSFSDELRTRALAAALEVSGGVRPAVSPGKRGLIRVLSALLLRSPARIARAFEGLDALQIPERQGPIRVLTPRLIAEAHRHGVEIHVWTVNDGQRMRELVALGVDGIVTDRTDIAVAALRTV